MAAKKKPATKADPTPSDRMRSLVQSVYDSNQRMNEAKRIYDAQRKELLSLMLAEGIRKVSVDPPATLGGGALPLTATITNAVRTVIDVKELRKVVSDDIFMHCISATKTAVEEHAGGAVVTRCVTVAFGEENVTVKPGRV